MNKRISLTAIVIGAPLAWEVCDAANNLLLRKGFIVQNEMQMEALIRRGLFIAGEPYLGATHTAVAKTPSALRLVNDANKRLGRLFHNNGRRVGFAWAHCRRSTTNALGTGNRTDAINER